MNGARRPTYGHGSNPTSEIMAGLDGMFQRWEAREKARVEYRREALIEQAQMTKSQPVRVSHPDTARKHKADLIRPVRESTEACDRRARELTAILRGYGGEWVTRRQLADVSGLTIGQLTSQVLDRRLTALGCEVTVKNMGRCDKKRYRWAGGEA